MFDTIWYFCSTRLPFTNITKAYSTSTVIYVQHDFTLIKHYGKRSREEHTRQLG